MKVDGMRIPVAVGVRGIGRRLLRGGLGEKAGRVLGSPGQLDDPGMKPSGDKEERVTDNSEANDSEETVQVASTSTQVAAATPGPCPGPCPCPTIVPEHLQVDVEARYEERHQGNQPRHHHPARKFERPMELWLSHSQIEK